MSNLFKRALFATLTMLVLAVMPLQAANAYSVEQGAKQLAQAPKECVGAMAAKEIAKVEADGGSVTVLDGAKRDAFIDKLSDIFGKRPPYPVSSVTLVLPDNEEETSYNVGIFSEGCLVGFLQIPQAVIETLVKPDGEKVD